MANGQWLKAESLSNVVRWAFLFSVKNFSKIIWKMKFFALTL